MYKRILTTASIFVLATSTAALAQTKNNNTDTPNTPTISEKDIKEGWENTKDVASEAAEATGNLVEGTLIEVREAIIDRENAVTAVEFVNYHPKRTAASIIGSQVQDTEGNMVGNIEDILIDDLGRAQYFILGDGSTLSFGDKKVAFEYERLARKAESGIVVAPITEELIEKKQPYDPKVHQGYKLSKMLDGEILNSNGKIMASIDNVLLENGRISHTVTGFDKFLGIGGESVALPYGIGTIAVQDNETDIILDDLEAANFQALKLAMK